MPADAARTTITFLEEDGDLGDPRGAPVRERSDAAPSSLSIGDARSDAVPACPRCGLPVETRLLAWRHPLPVVLAPYARRRRTAFVASTPLPG